MSIAGKSVRDLRRRWKPHKERLNAGRSGHPTTVRFHRACSWLQRAEQADGSDDLDLVLMSQWIAFNALYGQWDEGAKEPVSDHVCWRHFVDRILSLDKDKIVTDVLMDNKPLVMTIFDDEYLSRYFWREPNDKRAKRSRKTKFDARTWYLEGCWTLILDRLIVRVYLLRCQLVHGAATYNSRLNRRSIRRSSQMMDHLIRSFLLVWINQGADEDWGIMCYPPMSLMSSVR
ncbi:hypothetical protein LOC67_20235 [Stieleria sp. JC731]|uniref:HEPN domain-containing protein n=1 Tax=Pirellulaceae TaxID=2691357 RepID=UPI001E34D9B9|nr:HEPN domain-containing protein [Stieleria sp. JC731]MCC9602885.1 hypothetical protein [Stieleria sp. JC731]